MTVVVDVQRITELPQAPSQPELQRWVEAALAEIDYQQDAELVLRIVDAAEAADLNQRYRQRPQPTNVLSFPFQSPPGLARTMLLGDVVICAPVVCAEAAQQNKDLRAHWAHMVIHGVLHLMNYDHQTDSQADAMEKTEIRILNGLGYPDPYGDSTDV